MPANSYHFVSQWHVAGTLEEVSSILDDASSLSSWWGSVYSDVRLVDAGAPDGIGKVFSLIGKGWLPYKLHLSFRKTEDHRPNGFTVAVSGDLNGTGAWRFVQDGPDVLVTFDWIVSADKAILRWFSPVFRPLFASNHRWTMRRGEESLRLELLRRRAGSAAELATIPPPPAPFALQAKWLVLAGTATLAAIAVARRLRRRFA
jgi:hypothetical protein